jgi:hypothetical protein
MSSTLQVAALFPTSRSSVDHPNGAEGVGSDGAPEQITFGPTQQEGTAITPDGRYLTTSMGIERASVWRAL